MPNAPRSCDKVNTLSWRRWCFINFFSKCQNVINIFVNPEIRSDPRSYPRSDPGYRSTDEQLTFRLLHPRFIFFIFSQKIGIYCHKGDMCREGFWRRRGFGMAARPTTRGNLSLSPTLTSSSSSQLWSSMLIINQSILPCWWWNNVLFCLMENWQKHCFETSAFYSFWEWLTSSLY